MRRIGIVEQIYNQGKTNDLIHIVASCHLKEHKPENMLIPNNDELYWDSYSLPGVTPFFIISFPSIYFESYSYALRNWQWVRRIVSWTVEGSYDNKTWNELDRKVDHDVFSKNEYQTIEFPMKRNSYNHFKFTFQKALFINVSYISYVDIFNSPKVISCKNILIIYHRIIPSLIFSKIIVLLD